MRLTVRHRMAPHDATPHDNDTTMAVDALEAVLEHPLCDRGTALMIYWLGEPTYFADFASDEDVPEVNRSLKEFLNRVQNQLMSEQFKSNTICFDPMVDMNVVQRRKIENAGTIPAVLKKPNC